MSLSLTAGMKLTAARLNRLVPIHESKPADTLRSSTITRTADPDLVLGLNANVTYDVRGLFIVTSAANAAGHFSYELQFPTGATVSVVGSGANNTALASGSNALSMEVLAALPDSSSPTSAFPYAATTTPTGIILEARIVMGSTAGNLTVAWAQFASNASATALKAGSWITARPVDA